ATLPTQSMCFHTSYADALALPLRSGSKVLGAFHLCKANGYFSDRNRKFAETLVGHAAHVFRGLLSRRALEADAARLRAALPDGDELVGDSRAMVTLRSEVGRSCI